MAARQEQRPRSVLAEARGEQGGGAERLDHQILDFVRAGKEQLDFRRRVGFRHAEHHAVVRPHRLYLEPAILLETAHHGRGPRGMNPSAEWGQHAHAPVSHLVQVTLADPRLIAGNLARGVGLVVQVLDEVRRRAFVEPVPLQPRQRLGFRGAGQLARQASDVHPELQGAAGSIAVPEGHLPRFAGRGSDDHLVLGDLLDPPAGSAEDEHVALSRLEDHLFIQLAHAPLLAASGLSGLQEHAIEAAIRNGSGVRDRHARRPLASAQRARDPVPGEARTQLGELVRRIPAREHVEHALERAAGEIREGCGAPHQRVHLVHLVHAVRRVRDDLLGEHVERVAGIERLLHLACGHAPGQVEETFYPRNPLDVLAQQIVAHTANGVHKVDEVYALVRRAAPFADLPRSSFEGVLDMLSGRYPSDEFAELRPRLTWDRIAGTLRAREGAARVAIANAGTIPDRGLYGVFLETGEAGGGKQRRVGELDEEMVFESREGDVFVLGASSWRIEEITEDKVIVTPAPGEPGKMPFWHGDRPGRPLEFGMHVGRLSRELARAPKAKALTRLQRDGLDERAAANLVQYLHDQADATGEVPSDETVIVERYLDEVGDWRVCVLTPFGARVHAPWTTAVVRRLEQDRGLEVETMWTDDGMVFRVPESDAPPEVELFFPRADEVEDLVVQALGTTSLFAARFRENAARALLLPRRHPGRRSPLWAQRKRARDLLQVASRYGSFPLLLETHRECLRDVFDLPALQEGPRKVPNRALRAGSLQPPTPSPFAASLLFSYTASFISHADPPLAERRAQALSVDQAQLRELLGEAEMRELLDARSIAEHEHAAQRLGRPAHGGDGLHDLLPALGDLSEGEIHQRFEGEPPLQQLFEERRAFPLNLAGPKRWATAEDAARVRDPLGVPPPAGLPRELLEPVKDPLGDLVSRRARTHGPFPAEDLAARWGVRTAVAPTALERLARQDRVLEGEFLPGGRGRGGGGGEGVQGPQRRPLAEPRQQGAAGGPARAAR